MRVGTGYPSSHARHVVQFFGNDQASLVQNVSAFLTEGLDPQGGGLVIAGPERREALASALHGDRRFTYLDAREMLSTFMAGGRPHAALFDGTIGKLIRGRVGNGEVRAYGEMVGYLWTAGQHDAATELEELWNSLLARSRFSLFCGYPIDADASVKRIVAAHTQCVGAD